MGEYVVPLPSQCNPHRFLLHRDMLIHAVMCWNRALDYVDNVLGGTLAEGVRYITFEDFTPADLSPFYPLTTRDMRINPDQYWKPDAHVDRALWQRITDYIREIVTTDGEILRTRIGTTGSLIWERGGPIKTDPNDPESWIYQSGDQDLLRGMESGRYRPADWLYLSLVGEYHRLVSTFGEPLYPARIIRVRSLNSLYEFEFVRTDVREVITYQQFQYPAWLAREIKQRFDFSRPQLNVNIIEYWGDTIDDSAFTKHLVINEYNWPSSIPSFDIIWDTLVRGSYIESLDLMPIYLDDVILPTKKIFVIAKDTGLDVIASMRYRLIPRGEFLGEKIIAHYNGSNMPLTLRYEEQTAIFILSGPKDSVHTISIDLPGSVHWSYDLLRTREIPLATDVYYAGNFLHHEEIIGRYSIHEFKAKVDWPSILFNWNFAYA